MIYFHLHILTELFHFRGAEIINHVHLHVCQIYLQEIFLTLLNILYANPVALGPKATPDYAALRTVRRLHHGSHLAQPSVAAR